MPPFKAGQKVVVTQQIPHGERAWSCRISGEVVRYEQCKTGSWYAHAKDHKLWLDRLTLRKDDGEIVTCVLDPYTQVAVCDQTDSSDTADPAGTKQAHTDAQETTDAA